MDLNEKIELQRHVEFSAHVIRLLKECLASYIEQSEELLDHISSYNEFYVYDVKFGQPAVPVIIHFLRLTRQMIDVTWEEVKDSSSINQLRCASNNFVEGGGASIISNYLQTYDISKKDRDYQELIKTYGNRECVLLEALLDELRKMHDFFQSKDGNNSSNESHSWEKSLPLSLKQPGFIAAVKKAMQKGYIVENGDKLKWEDKDISWVDKPKDWPKSTFGYFLARVFGYKVDEELSPPKMINIGEQLPLKDLEKLFGERIDDKVNRALKVNKPQVWRQLIDDLFQ